MSDRLCRRHGVFHTRLKQGEGVSSVLLVGTAACFYYLGLPLQLGGVGTGLGSGLGSTWVAVIVSRWGLSPWEISRWAAALLAVVLMP